MDAKKFVKELSRIIEETGATELHFTVADSGGYDCVFADTPGIFVRDESTLIVGGSEDKEVEDFIGGTNDLLKEV